MKKLILILSIFFAISISFALCSCKEETINDAPNQVIVCLGNSLTAGFGATTPRVDDPTKSYPAFLQEKVNIPVINAGVSGNTSAMGLARVASDVLSHDPQIVIIELGANDLLQKILLPITLENLQQIINLVNDGRRKVYLVKFYTEEMARALAITQGITDYDMQTFLIQQYDNMFNMLATSNNIELIEDIWSGIWDIHMSDPIHPNAQGYKLMANHYFKALEPYLKENNFIK